jgi:hypothetical protein
MVWLKPRVSRISVKFSAMLKLPTSSHMHENIWKYTVHRTLMVTAKFQTFTKNDSPVDVQQASRRWQPCWRTSMWAFDHFDCAITMRPPGGFWVWPALSWTIDVRQINYCRVKRRLWLPKDRSWHPLVENPDHHPKKWSIQPGDAFKNTAFKADMKF